jgi:SAM-dependent methyltransferase
MGQPEFDTEGVFDEDYLYFYADVLTDARSDGDVALITRLLDIEPGQRVLDLACGHGRIANRLAARGCVVTGLDATPLFLRKARAEATHPVEYVEGDMRDLPWTAEFDRIVLWFTAFGYFSDAENRHVLREMARALRPGGRLVIDMNNRDWLVKMFRPEHVVSRGDDFMIDRTEIRPLAGRTYTERIVVRDGRVRRTSFVVRLFTFTELRDWLLDAGLEDVQGFGEDGQPLTVDSRRLMVTARCPLAADRCRVFVKRLG